MTFFDTTPIGQILNLCTSDTDYMDFRSPGTFYTFFTITYQFLGTMTLLIIANFFISPIIIIIFIVFIFIIKRYLKTTMELRRLNQLAISPILSNFSEYFNGLNIFRSLKKEKFINDIYVNQINDLCKIQYHESMTTAYVNLIVELFVSIMIFSCAVLIAIGKINEWSMVVDNPDLMALSLNWIMILPLSINFLMFSFSECVKGMTSIQRIFLNIEHGEEEADHDKPLPPTSWP